MKNTLTILILLSATLLAACSAAVTPDQAIGEMGETVTVGDGTYTNITPSDLQALLVDKDFLLINVHIPFEGDIPGTDLSIPYNDIKAHTGLLPDDPAAHLVIYCKSGPMSDIAAKTLLEMGYTHIYNLEDGFLAWEAEGLPLED